MIWMFSLENTHEFIRKYPLYGEFIGKHPLYGEFNSKNQISCLIYYCDCDGTKELTPKRYMKDLKLIMWSRHAENISEFEDTISEKIKFQKSVKINKNSNFMSNLLLRLRSNCRVYTETIYERFEAYYVIKACWKYLEIRGYNFGEIPVKPLQTHWTPNASFFSFHLQHSWCAIIIHIHTNIFFNIHDDTTNIIILIIYVLADL